MNWKVHYPNEEALETLLPRSLGHMFYECVLRTPDQVAFDFFDHDQRLTYSELSDHVRRVAASLRRMGARKGTHIAIVMPNRIEFPVLWFAITWIGAVSVQLNPKYTGGELGYALNDADVDFLVIDETCLAAFDSMSKRPARLTDASIVVIGTADSSGPFRQWQTLLDSEPLDDCPSEHISQGDLTSILYTSGTTGFPKGCMLGHRYWLQLARSTLFCQGGHHPQNVLIYEPMFYMQGNFIMLTAMLANATIFCPSHPSIAKFLGWVETFAIDYCAYPAPAVVGIEDVPTEKGRSLQWVHAWYFHGDALERLESRFDVVARDVYGMTENGCCLYVPVDRPDIAASGAMGIVAPWREVRLVDGDGNDVPEGSVGELWTAGPGHLHGYYRKPDANADAFRGKWFRTGDLMRRDAAGAYHLIGRIKDMVKRSGENISAAEVEHCLCKMPGVMMAAVVPVPDELRGEEIKAYVRLEEGMDSKGLPPSQILEYCAQRIASFKVPRYLAYVEAFPMTAGNDKIAKPRLIAGVTDLALDAFDRIDQVWR
jgi:acyl-CoA synthetase (AMP-forming)/AMP-acid ligase II